MTEPTVGQISGFKPRDIHTKFKDVKELPDDLIQTTTFVGYITPLMRKMGVVPVKNAPKRKKMEHIVYPYKPQNCKKCGSPMQVKVRIKANIELGIPAKLGYTCNRSDTGCENAKAKKHINSQKVKAWLNRTPPPKVKKVEGVQLKDSMIHA